LRAERRFNDVRALANSLMFEVHDSIKDLPGSTPARKLIVDRALQYLNRLAAESQGDISLQRELAEAYERVGLVQGRYLQSSLGDTQGSLDSYRKALQIRMQVGAKSSDWNDRLALARAHRSVASLLLATGDSRGARENADTATAISEALNTVHPKEAKVLDELSSDYAMTGRTRNTGSSSDTSETSQELLSSGAEFRRTAALGSRTSPYCAVHGRGRLLRTRRSQPPGGWLARNKRWQTMD
jgi:eukaryotic-like serine/threonine-protein kinase